MSFVVTSEEDISEVFLEALASSSLFERSECVVSPAFALDVIVGMRSDELARSKELLFKPGVGEDTLSNEDTVEAAWLNCAL
jgi:hypothetical protein